MKRYNEQIEMHEWIAPGKILRIPESAARTKKKDNETGEELPEEEQKYFRLVECSTKYPDGSTGVVDAILWEGQFLTGLFQEGMDIQLAIQMEGEYAGRGKVELPPVRTFDFSKVADAGVSTQGHTQTVKEEDVAFN